MSPAMATDSSLSKDHSSNAQDQKSALQPDAGKDTLNGSPTEIGVTSNVEKATTEDEAVEEVPFSVALHTPGISEPLTVMATAAESVQDLRQSVMDAIQTCHMSCFHLVFQGKRVNDFALLGEIEGLVDGSRIEVVESDYTDREARIHINRLRDLLSGPIKDSATAIGIDAGISVFSTLNDTFDVESPMNADGESEPDLSRAKEHAMTGYDIDASAKLHDHVPKIDRVPIQCLRNFAMSCWTPPPQSRKMKGDLMYLSFTTMEGESVHVTAHVGGFYLNKSTNQTFDPTPRTPASKSFSSHSLILLLRNLSAKFNSQFSKLQDSLTNHALLEILPSQSFILPSPWAVRSSGHSADPMRAAELYLNLGADAADAIHDWNDELQTHRELPKSTLQERLNRDRGINKIQAEFAEAARKGAMAIVHGDVVPLNPTEPARSHMYMYNNIFFSKGFDGRETFAHVGGDAAAHVATGKDLEGVRLINDVDVEGLFTLGSTVVDYKGERIVAQSIVPGIFRTSSGSAHKIVYGTFEGQTTIGADPEFHSRLGEVAKRLHHAEHVILDVDGKEVKVYPSSEAKGLLGDDGRRYMLDLYRLCPVDVLWLEKECSPSEGTEPLPAYPHQMVLLRPELVESFWVYRFRQWVKEQGNARAEEQNAVANENGEAVENSKIDDEHIAESSTTKKPDGSKVEEPSLLKDLNVEDFKLAFNTDVFTTKVSMPKNDDQSRQENDVRECSKFLRDIVIPAFVVDAITQGNMPVDGESLTKAMHKHGINMRYLGLIVNLCDKMSSGRAAVLKDIATTEMVARTAKRILRTYLSNLPVTHVADCVAHYLNCLLGAPLNKTPKAAINLVVASDLSNEIRPLDYTALTPESLLETVAHEIAERYRFSLPAEFLQTDVRRLPLLRSICLRVGIQIESRNYQFTAGDGSEELKLSHQNGTATVETNGRRKRRPQSSDARTEGILTFRPENVLNLVPLVKQAVSPSSFASEALESGRQALNQEQSELGFELLNESLLLYEQTYGYLHPEVAGCYASVAMLHYQNDQIEYARELQAKATVIYERTVGFDQAETLHSYMNLGLFEYGCSRPRAALRYLKHARKIWSLVYGPAHPDSGVAENNIAVILQTLGDFDTSLQLFLSARRMYEDAYGVEHVLTATNYHLVAKGYYILRDYKTALVNERVAFRVFDKLLGPEHVRTKESSQWLQEFTGAAVRSAKQSQEEKKGQAAATSKSTSKTERRLPPVNQMLKLDGSEKSRKTKKKGN